MSEQDATMPAIGSEIMMPVSQSPTRTTLFPEQVIVASAGKEFLELMFLRNELSLPVQQGRVKSHSGGRAEIEVTNSPIAAQLTDIGHVRLAPETCLQLVVNTARHLIQFHDVDANDLIRRLTEGSGVAKSPE